MSEKKEQKEKKASSKKIKPSKKKTEVVAKKMTATKSTKKKTISSKKQAKEISDIAKKWKVLNDKMKDKKALIYDMHNDYSMGDAIEHQKFGRGYAVAVKNNRIYIIFKDCKNVLICNVKG